MGLHGHHPGPVHLFGGGQYSPLIGQWSFYSLLIGPLSRFAPPQDWAGEPLDGCVLLPEEERKELVNEDPVMEDMKARELYWVNKLDVWGELIVNFLWST